MAAQEYIARNQTIMSELMVSRSERWRGLRLFAACALSLALPLVGAEAPAGSAPTNSRPASPPAPVAHNPEIEQLKAMLAEQQLQINELRDELAKQRTTSSAAQSNPEPSNDTAGRRPSLGEVASTTPIIPSGVNPSARVVNGAFAPAPALVPQAPVPAGPPASETSPLQLKIGDATLTPVGFMDLTNTWRSTNAGSSLQTNFGSFPYNNTVQGRLSEDKWSTENSRLGFRVDTKVRGANVLGYFEGDFVGLGNAANNTQVSSNSMLFRIRQYYVDVRKGFWEVLAGQAWSMIVPNRKGMSPLPADLFYSQVVDVNYTNGLYWGRIPGIRIIGHPNNKVTFGFALENSTQYFGGSGGGGVPTLPAGLATTYNAEVDNSMNNDRTIPNVHPDILGKLVIEPSNRFHFEIGGVESTVKTFNPITNKYFTKAGGAGTFAINAEIVKNFRVVTNNFWGDGAGRYLFGAVPNFIIRSDGSPSLMHAASTVSGFEATIKNIAPYIYYGGVYAARNTALDANGTTRIGYGYTGSPNSQNRSIQEVTAGLTHTLWKDAKYGALQYMVQYAYFFRNPWYVAANAPKNAHESAVWFNLRYVLPGSAPTIKY